MVTLTFPSWWAFTLYFAGLGALGYVAARVGDRVGHAVCRRVQRRKTRCALRDTLRA
jgi:MFS family permease